MNNVIRFPNSDVKEYRSRCVFMNREVQVVGENGAMQKYPCIVLYEEDTDIPVLYTGLERYLCHLVKSELLNSKTLSAKAYAICHFLNYILKETDINSLHECTLMPEISEEWNYEKNRGKTPQMFTKSSNKKVWWNCKNEHEWRAMICDRTTLGNGCPICLKIRRNKLQKGGK